MVLTKSRPTFTRCGFFKPKGNAPAYCMHPISHHHLPLWYITWVGHTTDSYIFKWMSFQLPLTLLNYYWIKIEAVFGNFVILKHCGFISALQPHLRDNPKQKSYLIILRYLLSMPTKTNRLVKLFTQQTAYKWFLSCSEPEMCLQ